MHDPSISPVIRQTLLHWAYEITDEDYALWLTKQQQKEQKEQQRQRQRASTFTREGGGS